MVEVLVAAGLIVVGATAMLALLGRSLGYAKTVASEYVAANLAAEGIELVRALVDRDFRGGLPFGSSLGSGSFEMDYNDTALRSFGGAPLLFDEATGLYGYDAGAPTPFRRRIVIDTDPNGNTCIEEVAVRSIVEWSQRSAQFKVDVEDRLFDWRGAGACP